MENQRVRLTKKMLKSALMELLKDKPIEKIAIRELCSKAEINHTTFYKYYGSQYDLLDEIESEYFEELECCLRESSMETRDGLTSALRFIDREKERWKVLINAVHEEEFAKRLFTLPVISKRLNDYLNTAQDESTRTYIRLFLCQGGYAIIRYWINNENEDSPEEISVLIWSLIKKLI